MRPITFVHLNLFCMKHFFVIAFCICTIATLAQSQSKKFKLIEGPENEGRRSAMESVVGEVDGGVLIFRTQKRDRYLELIDDKAQVVKSVLLEGLKYKNIEKVLASAYVINNRLYLRFSAHDKAKKKFYGIIEEYDPKSLTFLKEINVEEMGVEALRKVYWYGIGAGRAIDEMSETGSHISNERKFIVDYNSTFEKSKKTNENVFMVVYDAEMNKSWEMDYEIPYSNDLFQIVKVIVDDAGNAHLLGREYFDKARSSRNGKPNYKYHVLSFLEKGKLVKDNSLELSGEFINDAAIGISSDGYLIASGFYGSKDVFSIDGTFSAKIDINKKEVIMTNKKEFDKEFIQIGMTDREKRKSDRKEDRGVDLELPNYDLDRMVLLEDGGWLLIAEQFYITQRTTTSTGPNGAMTTNTVIVYNYDDIIAVKMNKQGEIEWNAKIPKHQSTTGNTNALSYTWTNCNGSFVFVYNSSLGRKESIVYASVIDAMGKVENEILMTSERDELMLYPGYSSRIAECGIMLYSARKKNYRFSIMKMN